MKKSSIIITISIVISIIVGVLGGVYISSKDNLKNRDNKYKSITFGQNEMILEGWQQNSKYFISQKNDSSVILNGIDGYVNNLYFDGFTAEMFNKPVKIYYTTESQSDFTEDNSFECKAQEKGSEAYFTINKEVSALKVVLVDTLGVSAKIRNFVVNPTNIIFSFNTIFICVSVLVCAVSLILFLLFFRTSIKGYLFAFNKYKALLKNLIERDLKVKYRRSALGIMWSVLNPLLMMLVISAVFANVFKFNIKDFPIYYITGAWIFNFVSEATSTSLTSVIGAAPLIKKVYIPKYIFPVEKCMFSFVNMMFSLIAVAIVYIIFQVKLHITVLLFPVIMIYALFFSIGLSLILAAFNVFFRDIGHLYSVWVTAWMYFTPIIYPVSALPEVMIKIIKINPLYYYVNYARDIMIYGRVPTLEQNLICIGFSALAMICGLLIFKKKQDKFILYI